MYQIRCNLLQFFFLNIQMVEIIILGLFVTNITVIWLQIIVFKVLRHSKRTATNTHSPFYTEQNRRSTILKHYEE